MINVNLASVNAIPVNPIPVIGAKTPTVTAVWTSSTLLNTSLILPVIGYGSVIIAISSTSTITNGVIMFEVSDASNNWYAINVMSTNSQGLGFPTYFLSANTNQAFRGNVAGFANFRVRLSTAIAGTGTVQISTQANSMVSNDEVVAFIRTPSSAIAVADNFTSSMRISDSAGNAFGLGVNNFSYGGQFSSTPDITRQGWLKSRTPTVFLTASVAATTTGNSAIWTPASGNFFRLLGFQLTAQGLAATATGVVTVSFQDSTTSMPVGIYSIDIPAVASVVSGVNQISGGAVYLGAFGIISAAANNVLNFNISAAGAGTVGTYRVTVWGVEE
jgi:hypothetical protein